MRNDVHLSNITASTTKFKDDLNRDPDRFRLWEDFVFDVYQGDEGQLKSLQNRVQVDDLHDGFSLLIDVDNSGSICVNSNIPNIARPFVCLLIFQIALKAPPKSFVFLRHGWHFGSTSRFRFERVNPIPSQMGFRTIVQSTRWYRITSMEDDIRLEVERS